nr:MAG TPA: hypothetical protein [Caudoviricetes sp.]
MNYRDDYDDDYGLILGMKIMTALLGGGLTLLLLAVFAKIAVDVWTGGCAG